MSSADTAASAGGPAVRIEGVISDFGGVLTSPLNEAFAAFQESSGVSVVRLAQAMRDAARSADGRHPLHELETGRISEPEFLRRLEAELGEEVTLAGFSEAFFAHLHPNRPMIDLMRALRGRGLRMGLLTNNVREWEPLWRAKLPEIDQVFEVVVDSAFVGMRKPDPEIYRLTLGRFSPPLPPEACVFVDDVEVNCDAARGLGMHAVQYRSAEQAIREIEAVLG